MTPRYSLILNFVLTLCIYARIGLGILTNITIDDTLGDPSTNQLFNYTPAGIWHVGQNCSECHAQLEAGHMLGSSWHDNTFSPGKDGISPEASVTFNGVG